MSQFDQTLISYDIKNADEPIENDTRQFTTPSDNGQIKVPFLRKFKGSHEFTNFSLNSERIHKSILSSSVSSPKQKSIDWRQTTNISSTSNIQEKSLSNCLDPFLNQMSNIINNYSAMNPSLISFIQELEKILINMKVEIKRVEKQSFLINQQLQITTKALHQRDSVLNLMREESLQMQKKVQQAQMELESNKLKHERFTKQNNDNFYKISKQIKESINIKSQKQQQQIEHLKNIIKIPNIIQNTAFKNKIISPFNPKTLNSSPIQNSIKGLTSREKSNGNLHTNTPYLESIYENNLIKKKPRESLRLNYDKLDNVQEHFGNQNTNVNKKGRLSQCNNDYQLQTQIDLPDEAKFDEIRKFFIQSDLSDLKCNKSQREINLSKKIKMQKAKLHSMFLLSTPFTKVVDSKNNTPVQSPSNSIKQANKIIQNTEPVQQVQNTEPVQQVQNVNQNNTNNNDQKNKKIEENNKDQELQTVQKQFNQALTINYHHTKASSLVQQFFEFKDDKKDDDQPPQSPELQTLISSRQSSNQTIEKKPLAKNEFLQHSSDYHFFTLLLDMSKSDKSIMKVHNENIFIKFITNIGRQEMVFREFLMNLTPDKYSNLFESIKHIVSNEFAALNTILNLKKIIVSVQKMHSSLMLTDAFTTIINETCTVLSCDRASVFLIDPKRNELWTKVAKNSKPIRTQIGTGLAGIVALTGETLNILDAHQDQRFNKDIDKQNNYRTKSVLCLPIKDQNQNHIIGVIQAINKNESDFFTKEDEGLLLILSQLATAVLRNSLYHDERETFHHSLKNLLDTGKKLQEEKSIKQLLVRSQSLLYNRFDVQQANIWIYDQDTNELVRYYLNDDQLLDDYIKVIDENCILEQRCKTESGIIGHAFLNCSVENILNAYQHKLFNSCVDLNTSMPIITTILRAQLDDNDRSKYRKIGVLQCVNPKGLESLIFNSNQKNGAEITHAFYETLDHFGQIIGENIKRFLPDDYF